MELICDDINEGLKLPTTKTELLFVERIFNMLKMGGTAAVIVPQGVLFGSGKAFEALRKTLIEKAELKAVIAMPSGVFKPYAGVATAILVFTKGGETNNIWFYEMKSDGRTLDDKRNEITKTNGERDFGDLHTIIKEFKKTERNEDRSQQHFVVSKSEIVENDYDLSFSKYQQLNYVEKVYDTPKEILENLLALEKNIFIDLEELNNMVK